MAQFGFRYPENVPGPFYVDKNCSACGICVVKAPYNFEFTTGDKHAYVHKQPETYTEKASCQMALESCPEDAIGSDGENAGLESKPENPES